jgi:hypothetical protein
MDGQQGASAYKRKSQREVCTQGEYSMLTGECLFEQLVRMAKI